MAQQTIVINASPHDGQRQVHEALHDGRVVVLDSGRRWGKTRLGVNECLDAAARGGRAWWVAPSYKVAAVGWRPLQDIGERIGAEVRRVDRQVTLPSGGWVQVRSADDPASLRGEGLDLVVVDEAAHISKFEEAWKQALRPALSDRKGKALFISTPKGFNHFYELYRDCDSRDDWQAFQFPSWTNPYLDADEIEDAKRDLPDLVFRQEYGAEFVQLAGALFRREWFGIIDDAPELRYARYWDLAASEKKTADYTVGAKVGLASDGALVIADIVRGRWEWPDAIRAIGQTAKMDGPAVTQGIEDVGVQKGLYQMLIREPSLVGLPFVPVGVHKDKLTRATPWLARAEQSKVDLVRGNWNAAFLDEVCAFPEVNHDDQVDAVSGAVQMLSTTGVRVLW